VEHAIYHLEHYSEAILLLEAGEMTEAGHEISELVGGNDEEPGHDDSTEEHEDEDEHEEEDGHEDGG
jgi:hypothetical protein